MTDKLEEWEPGYARKEALRRLEASANGEPWEPKPAILLRLSHPTSNVTTDRRSTLLIGDEVSGVTILELELDSVMLHELLASRSCRPRVDRYTRNPERIGHPETMWTVTCESPADAEDMGDRLRDLGWTVSSKITKVRGGRTGPAYLWPVTGRRWDGEREGIVCDTCGWPVPARFGAWCPECER